MENETLPSNPMTNDIVTLAGLCQFTSHCFFMSEKDIERLKPLMIHFGFSDKQREAIVALMKASMED